MTRPNNRKKMESTRQYVAEQTIRGIREYIYQGKLQYEA